MCLRVLGPRGGWVAAPSDPTPGPPLQTNEKGQVVTKTALLKQMEELIEEPGLTCCICREGYKFQVRCRARRGSRPGPAVLFRGGRGSRPGPAVLFRGDRQADLNRRSSSNCRSRSQALCPQPLCQLSNFIFKRVMKSPHLWMRKQYP